MILKDGLSSIRSFIFGRKHHDVDTSPSGDWLSHDIEKWIASMINLISPTPNFSPSSYFRVNDDRKIRRKPYPSNW